MHFVVNVQHSSTFIIPAFEDVMRITIKANCPADF